MKKKILIIAISLIVLGTVICIIASATIGFDYRKLQIGGEFVTNTFKTTKVFKDIIIDEENSTNIKIIKTTNTYCTITYKENEKEKYEFKEDNNTLTINGIENYQWYDYIINISSIQSKDLIIEVPETFNGELEIESRNGKIEIEDLNATKIDVVTSNGGIELENIIANEMKVETSNGGFYLKNVNSGSIDLKTSNGAFKLQDVTTNLLETETSNGSVTLNDVVVNGNIKTTTRNGGVEYRNVTSKDLDVDTRNGSIKLYNVTSSSKIDLKTDNNSIQLDRVKCETSMILKTSNGSIKGTIVGEYEDFRITSETSNGNNNLPTEPQGSGAKELNVDTSNGNIDIKFVD